jgi:RNase H-fold protein (predicted Holliday junction resolvase)
MRYLAIDPGTQKAGVAIADLPDEPLAEKQLLPSIRLLHRAVLPLDELLSCLADWLERYMPQRLLLGSGTGSRALLARLRERFPALHWELVEERDTTLQARALYFHFHPPRGWRRLLPMGLRVPPEPYDDYVALLLILRAHQKAWGVS